MGLHRRETILKTFRDETDRMIALRVLWSVYTLERRTSLSQGVPYSIQDSHIDPSLYTMASLGFRLNHPRLMKRSNTNKRATGYIKPFPVKYGRMDTASG